MSLVLPFADWPASDRAMWQALFAAGDLLDESGPLAHVRDTTRVSLEPRYGRWLRWLIMSHPADLALPPTERVTIMRLRDWLDDLAHTAPMTRLAFIDGVMRIVSAAAPERDWSAHSALRSRLKSLAGRGRQTRKQGRILSSAVLLDAGITLALRRADETRSPLFRASQIRDGAIIALLALMPIRRRALANLRIGESVFCAERSITIALPADLTKSGAPWEAVVPTPAMPALERYLGEARPLLLSRGLASDPHLWIDRKGKPLTYASIGPTIANATEKMTGVRVPPHFFRDAAATTLARTSSKGAKLIRPILAHSSTATAERHYNHARTIEAGRDYAALIAQMKGARS